MITNRLGTLTLSGHSYCASVYLLYYGTSTLRHPCKTYRDKALFQVFSNQKHLTLASFNTLILNVSSFKNESIYWPSGSFIDEKYCTTISENLPANSEIQFFTWKGRNSGRLDLLQTTDQILSNMPSV